MKPNPIDRLIEYLMGSTYSVEDALLMLEIDAYSDEVIEPLTGVIDLCLGCGRWHEISELEGTHNLYCGDCIQNLEE